VFSQQFPLNIVDVALNHALRARRRAKAVRYLVLLKNRYLTRAAAAKSSTMMTNRPNQAHTPHHPAAHHVIHHCAQPAASAAAIKAGISTPILRRRITGHRRSAARSRPAGAAGRTRRARLGRRADLAPVGRAQARARFLRSRRADRKPDRPAACCLHLPLTSSWPPPARP